MFISKMNIALRIMNVSLCIIEFIFRTSLCMIGESKYNAYMNVNISIKCCEKKTINNKRIVLTHIRAFIQGVNLILAFVKAL